MKNVQSLPWQEPLIFASGMRAPFALLYSGAETGEAPTSYLACGLAERIEGDDFSPLEKKLSADKAAFENAWFGYLGYGLKNSLEKLAADAPGPIALPNLCMLRFHTIYAFDHTKQTLTRWSDKAPHEHSPARPETAPPRVCEFHSNMSKAEYLQKAAFIIEKIRAGDLYQANLTRKFMGRFERAPDAFSLFRKLCGLSPAAYSAYIDLGDAQIISSSPELFLQVDAAGGALARPIKGSAPRFADAARDEASRAGLGSSEKDRAENLMIVDLMRNDLARSCIEGSVNVHDLFRITTHARIHHMSSAVAGRKREGRSTLDLVKNCFPPGSMTGAPKIKAMNLCSELEKQARGVYSGALGWFGGDGSCNLSVVIRTLIVQGGRFEFQVGGGIVADSTPEGELAETYAKAAGMMATLGLSSAQIEAL